MSKSRASKDAPVGSAPVKAGSTLFSLLKLLARAVADRLRHEQQTAHEDKSLPRLPEVVQERSPDVLTGTSGRDSTSAGSETHRTGSLPPDFRSHRATQAQLDDAVQLADEIPGLGARRLEELACRMFNKPLAELSRLDVTCLIDTLLAIKTGRISIAKVLDEVT